MALDNISTIGTMMGRLQHGVFMMQLNEQYDKLISEISTHYGKGVLQVTLTFEATTDHKEQPQIEVTGKIGTRLPDRAAKQAFWAEPGGMLSEYDPTGSIPLFDAPGVDRVEYVTPEGERVTLVDHETGEVIAND